MIELIEEIKFCHEVPQLEILHPALIGRHQYRSRQVFQIK